MTTRDKQPKRTSGLLALYEVLTVIEHRLGDFDWDTKKKLVRAIMLWLGVSKEHL